MGGSERFVSATAERMSSRAAADGTDVQKLKPRPVHS